MENPIHRTDVTLLKKRLHNTQGAELTAVYLRQNGERTPNEPRPKVEAYLGFLAHKGLVNDGLFTGDAASIEYQSAAAVIQDEHIPQGLRDNPDAIQEIRQAQHDSLKEWMEYLSSEDTQFPYWFRYMAFERVKRMGVYDEENKKFSARSRSTIAPFPPLNKRALTWVHEWLKMELVNKDIMTPHHQWNLDVDFDEGELFRDNLSKGRFAEVYSFALPPVEEIGGMTREQRLVTTGEWRYFPQGSSRDELEAAIEGFGVPWRMAAYLAGAHSPLEVYSYKIFMSHDENGVARVPRIAIELDDEGRIEEVKGIEPNETVEPRLLEMLLQEITSLPNSQEFIDRVNDEILFSNVHQLLMSDPNAPLTDEELGMLYELKKKKLNLCDFTFRSMWRLRGPRAMQDKERLGPLILEGLEERVAGAISSCIELQKSLPGAVLLSESELRTLWDQKYEEWRQAGILEYVIHKRDEVLGGRFLPIMVPNIDISADDQLAAVAAFGEQYKIGVTIDPHIFQNIPTIKKDATDSPVKITLLPERGRMAISWKSYKRHVSDAEADARHERLRPPTLIEAVASWHSSYQQLGIWRLSDIPGGIMGHPTMRLQHPIHGKSWLISKLNKGRVTLRVGSKSILKDDDCYDRMDTRRSII